MGKLADERYTPGWNLRRPKGYKPPGYVVVAVYAPSNEAMRVHVYGLFETRAAAEKEKRKSIREHKRSDEYLPPDSNYEPEALTWHVRIVNDLVQANELLAAEDQAVRDELEAERQAARG